MRTLVLMGTIPVRKHLAENALLGLERQSRVPDALVIRLDGYGDAPAPRTGLETLHESRTTSPTGAGGRWLAALDALEAGALDAEDKLLCVDDDAMLAEAPNFARALELALETGGAAAAMGLGFDGRRAPPQDRGRGALVYAAGLGLAVRVKHLLGLRETVAQVVAAGGRDPLGPLGDDDALVSAHLWKTGVRIEHAATGNVFAAPGSRATSQTAARQASKEPQDAQKLLIARATGWPWPSRPRP